MHNPKVGGSIPPPAKSMSDSLPYDLLPSVTVLMRSVLFVLDTNWPRVDSRDDTSGYG
jgi:hypothetical protein